MRPVIGITTYREQARWGLWDEPADVLFTMYADAVADAGGAPVLLPPVRPDVAADALARLDGVVVSGGADVDPARYGAQPDPRTGAPQPHRDEWELAVTSAAVDRALPLLAICRGMQVLNVARGGTLVQHLPDVLGTDVHAPVAGVFGHHDVRLDPGSRLGELLGDRVRTATHHHQAVDALGAGLRATAWADDGVVEAVELAGDAWVVGVQWHPEAFEGGALFAGFVAACRPAFESAAHAARSGGPR